MVISPSPQQKGFCTKTLVCLAVFILLFESSAFAQFGPARTQSTSTASKQSGNSSSFNCSLSGDGRYLIFDSTASNLVSAVPTFLKQIYLRDRKNGGTYIVSLSTSSESILGNAASQNASISRNGNFVVFDSASTNLTADSSFGASAVFRRNIPGETTELVSKTSDSTATGYDSNFADLSDDGNSYAFTSKAQNLVLGSTDSLYFNDVYVTSLDVHTTKLANYNLSASYPSGDSDQGRATISGDGRYVVFGSAVNDIVSGDANATSDVFIRDTVAEATEMVSLKDDQTQFSEASHSLGPRSISTDGRFILFSVESSPPQLYLRDRTLQTTELISRTALAGAADGPSAEGKISGDGNYVIFKTRASNILQDAPKGGIILLNRSNGVFTLITTKGNAPCVSDNGETVAYDAYDAATKHNQVFTKDIDKCPSDSNKELPGACGCGRKDTDTDLDGYPDCIESCPKDSKKVSKGICGCGVEDKDRNANTQYDCREIWFHPSIAKVNVSGRTATVLLQKYTKGIFSVTLTTRGMRSTKNYSKNQFIVKNLRSGIYTLQYRILDRSNGITVAGALSTAVKFTIK